MDVLVKERLLLLLMELLRGEDALRLQWLLRLLLGLRVGVVVAGGPQGAMKIARRPSIKAARWPMRSLSLILKGCRIKAA